VSAGRKACSWVDADPGSVVVVVLTPLLDVRDHTSVTLGGGVDPYRTPPKAIAADIERGLEGGSCKVAPLWPVTLMPPTMTTRSRARASRAPDVVAGGVPLVLGQALEVVVVWAVALLDVLEVAVALSLVDGLGLGRREVGESLALSEELGDMELLTVTLEVLVTLTVVEAVIVGLAELPTLGDALLLCEDVGVAEPLRVTEALTLTVTLALPVTLVVGVNPDEALGLGDALVHATADAPLVVPTGHGVQVPAPAVL
jgi:hypothetical protein